VENSLSQRESQSTADQASATNKQMPTPGLRLCTMVHTMWACQALGAGLSHASWMCERSRTRGRSSACRAAVNMLRDVNDVVL
jgi:hypothetical protein